MDTKHELNDDFLAELIRKTPLESPSEGFVLKVMQGIEPAKEEASEKTPIIARIKNFLPFILTGLVVLFILFSSDIPYLNLISGGEFIQALMGKIFQPLLASMKSMLTSKAVTYTLLIGVSAGFFFIIDRFFSRRFANPS